MNYSNLLIKKYLKIQKHRLFVLSINSKFINFYIEYLSRRMSMKATQSMEPVSFGDKLFARIKHLDYMITIK